MKQKGDFDVKLIVCLDKERGMMFNHRRQSRDRVLIADMIQHVKDSILWVSPYSAPLFGEDCPTLRIAQDPAMSAGKDDFCFVEDTPLPQNLTEGDEIIMYHWNRLYPSDVRFSCDMSSFRKKESSQFAGSSHEKIKKEIWKK